MLSKARRLPLSSQPQLVGNSELKLTSTYDIIQYNDDLENSTNKDSKLKLNKRLSLQILSNTLTKLKANSLSRKLSRNFKSKPVLDLNSIDGGKGSSSSDGSSLDLNERVNQSTEKKLNRFSSIDKLDLGKDFFVDVTLTCNSKLPDGFTIPKRVKLPKFDLDLDLEAKLDDFGRFDLQSPNPRLNQSFSTDTNVIDPIDNKVDTVFDDGIVGVGDSRGSRFKLQVYNQSAIDKIKLDKGDVFYKVQYVQHQHHHNHSSLLTKLNHTNDLNNTESSIVQFYSNLNKNALADSPLVSDYNWPCGPIPHHLTNQIYNPPQPKPRIPNQKSDLLKGIDTNGNLSLQDKYSFRRSLFELELQQAIDKFTKDQNLDSNIPNRFIFNNDSNNNSNSGKASVPNFTKVWVKDRFKLA